MARTLYGGSPADVIAQVNNDSGDPTPDFGPTSAVSLTAWDSVTGGTQLTSLQDFAGSAISQVTPDSIGRVLFWGPDAYADAIWLQDSSGTRWRINPADLAGRVAPTWTTIPGKPAYVASGVDAPSALASLGAAPAAHDHDTRYYTQAQIDALLATTQPPEILTWNVPGGLAVTADDVVPVYNDGTVARTIVAVRVSVGTAPATTAILVDINVAGTTIFTTQANRPSVAVGQLSSGKKTNMDVTNWPAGSPLAPNIDQVGSATSPGADMIIQVLVQ